jgi:ABC-2 type transport system ATP-binding protein
LRRQAFGGEAVELVLGGEPSSLAGRLKTLEEIGYAVEIRQEEGATTRVRLLVDDADARLPGVLAALDGADVRSANVPKLSFDKVFFHLVKEPSETA